jgi:hypothetical protein
LQGGGRVGSSRQRTASSRSVYGEARSELNKQSSIERNRKKQVFEPELHVYQCGRQSSGQESVMIMQ